ncbi:MAG: DUF1015 domain-containing protein [Gammaproteobacteria bacterium]|nr:MAG: DUF1015 domain-containing protein [Gammaproteobacteria bacterium]
MNLVSAFAAVRPADKYSTDVIAPPYDVLDNAEAKICVNNKPHSFLHISKAQIDLPDDTDPYADIVYQKAYDNLSVMLKTGVLKQDQKPLYYAYRITFNGVPQTGLVAGSSIAEYDKNRIRKHEYTRPVKENDRIKQINKLNMQTGPVLLTYNNSPQIDKILKHATDQKPQQSCLADDGILHEIWLIDNDETIKNITQIFNEMKAIYIADGHHRSAAASKVNKLRQKNNQSTEFSQYFLSVIFPSHQMKILPYNRVIKDLNALKVDELLQKIDKNFKIKKSFDAVHPQKNGQFGMYVDKNWYQLDIKPRLIPQNNPVAKLDVSLLADKLIEPFLGISDSRTDDRIDFVGGIRGLTELEKKVDTGDFAIAFSMFATSIDELISVADDNQVMPPKSTWFEPKLADGLFSLTF